MIRNSEVSVAVRRALIMGTVTGTGLSALPAAAQNQNQQPAAAEPEATITVTGTRIRRVEQETANPVLVIDQTAIESSGVATMGELLMRIPSVSGAATNPQVNNGGGFGESNVELRGLGAQRTLVLLNGRRINLVSNTTTSAVDVNTIPINTIERVEVLKEGASAIYGSDAIAGVVNFITRKDVDGVEVVGEYGQTGKNDGDRVTGGLLLGTNTDKMNLVFGANYNKQKGVSAGARDFSRFALYLYGGVVTQGGSTRTPGGRVLVPGVEPDGEPCSSQTRIEGTPGTSLADFRCFESSDVFNYQPFNLLLTPQERGSVFTELNYNVNDYVTTYGEVLFTHTSSGFELAALPFDAVQDDTIISANSIFNPFGIDFGGIDGINPNVTSRFEELGTRRSEVSTDDLLATLGAKGRIFDTGWNWDTYIGYGRKAQDQNIEGYLLKPNLADAVGPSFIDATGPRCGVPGDIVPNCTPINIFNIQDPAQVAALEGISSNYRTNYNYHSKVFTANATGTVWELPAGEPQVAVGFEYRDQEGQFSTDALTRGQPPLFLSCLLAQETCTGNSSAKYNVKEWYAEFFVPLLKDFPAVHSLNLNAGVRYSNYSKDTIGNSTNAQFKLEWRPIADLLARASYSEVFRAPTIADLSFAPSQNSPTFTDPCTALTQEAVDANPNLALACAGVPRDGEFRQPNSQITGLIVGSQDLKPETGEVQTYGLVYDSSLLRGFSASIDYWRYKLHDLITALDPNFASDQCVATGNPDFCGLEFRYPETSPNAGQFLVFRQPIVNLGELSTDGIDFNARYTIRDTLAGSFSASLDVTRILSYENTPAPGAEPIEIAGTFDRQFGNYAKYRGLFGLGWSGWNADALLTLRYVGKLDIPDPDGAIEAPPLRIGSVTYVDLTLGYTFPTKTHVQFGSINLLDKDPPFFYQNNVLNANTDVSTYDTIGRRWFVSVTQKF